MKIVFLLTHIPNPRINKRIALLKDSADITVICVRRASQDIWEPYYKDISHEILDIDLPSSTYFMKRLVRSRQYFNKASKLLKKISPDIIYTEGLDSLSIAVAYLRKTHRCSIIYEVADLRESFIHEPDSLIRRMINRGIKKQEKKLLKYISNLVITSEVFYKVHYCKLIPEDKVIFMPNIPESEPFKDYKRKNTGDFTIGFIGGIRYMDQMRLLVDAAESTYCRVLFAGAGGEIGDYYQLKEYCKDKDFVQFTGKYNYNREIAQLYGMVDCVYAVYDADNPNVRIALPNKLYESIYCELPIVVAKGTYLADIVNEWKVGFAVGHNDYNELCQIFRNLKYGELSDEIRVNCRKNRNKINLEKYNINLLKAINQLNEQNNFNS